MTNSMVIHVHANRHLPGTTVKQVSEIYTVYKINKAISRFEKKADMHDVENKLC
jgi:hypothetical protein